MGRRLLSEKCRKARFRKERAMDKMNVGVIRYFQESARDFTPVTVCADFEALIRHKCLDGEEGANGKEGVKTLISLQLSNGGSTHKE
jgi:hypothetical protein